MDNFKDVLESFPIFPTPSSDRSPKDETRQNVLKEEPTPMSTLNDEEREKHVDYNCVGAGPSNQPGIKTNLLLSAVEGKIQADYRQRFESVLKNSMFQHMIIIA